jgi:hypothetical protein
MVSAYCPTCGASLEDHNVCPRCGTLVALELRIAKIRWRAKAFLNAQFMALPQSFFPHYFLWLCAIAPFLLLPPLVSLVISVVSMRRSSEHSGMNDVEWIAVVSAINIILSLLILYKFHFSVAEFVSYLGSRLRMIFSVTPPFPLDGHHPSIRATPI